MHARVGRVGTLCLLKLQELMMVLQIEADTRRYKNTPPAPYNQSSGIP